MTAVNHFYSEQLTAQTHTGDSNFARGSLPQILGSALTATTKYLVIGYARLAGNDAADEFAIRINVRDDTTVRDKSEMLIQPHTVTLTDRGITYFFVHSFTSAATPLDVDMEMSVLADTANTVSVDQASLEIIDLDDYGSGNYFETVHADPGDGVNEYPTTQDAEFTIAGSNLGTDEFLVLAYQRTKVGSSTRDFRVEAFAAVDTSATAVRSSDQNEGENTLELRISGFALRHKASSGTPNFEIQTWEQTDSANFFDRGGYAIALKTSAVVDFEFAYTAATTTLDTTERTFGTITSYSPTTTADHLLFGMYDTTGAVAADTNEIHIEDDGTEMRVGDEPMLQENIYDDSGPTPLTNIFHQDNILSSDTSTYTLRGKTGTGTNDAEHRWLLLFSLEKVAGGAGSASPAAIAQAFTVDAVTQTGPGNIVPATTARVFTVDAVTVTGPGNITPTTIARIFTIDGVTVFGQTAVRPAVIARLFTMDAVTLAGPGNITPGAIVRAFTVDDVTTDGGGAAGNASPAAIIRAFTIDLPTLTGPGNITPATIARIFTVDDVTLLGQTTVRPATIARAFTVDDVTVTAGVNITAPLIARLFTVDGVTVTGAGNISPATIALAFALGDVTIITGQDPFSGLRVTQVHFVDVW